jgi:hypothetical protein
MSGDMVVTVTAIGVLLIALTAALAIARLLWRTTPGQRDI